MQGYRLVSLQLVARQTADLEQPHWNDIQPYCNNSSSRHGAVRANNRLPVHLWANLLTQHQLTARLVGQDI